MVAALVEKALAIGMVDPVAPAVAERVTAPAV
jgi:hypothetical protein